MIPKTLGQWGTLIAGSLIAGVTYWIGHDGPDLVVKGVPILAFLVTYVGTLFVGSNGEAAKTQALKQAGEQIDRLFARLSDKAPAFALAFGLTLCGLTLSGCLPARTPAQIASDSAGLEACISSHWGEGFFQLAGDCANGEVAVVEDFIATGEHLFMKTHGNAKILADGLPEDFPYRDRPSLMAKIQTMRAKALAEAQAKRAQ